jgi:hypothetical protein
MEKNLTQREYEYQITKRSAAHRVRIDPRLRSNLQVLLVMVCLALFAACSKAPPQPEAKAGAAERKPATSLVAVPNPIVTSDGSGIGETSITWTTTASQAELRVGATNGQVFARGGSQGTAQTGKWVRNGMTFYLQDLSNPNPTTESATLGHLTMAVQ